ncbi:hypothetical protein PR048_018101 [Dryococelus australis]|uniref:Integrase catalytic domain-containing protein n=1 Tax=Dryococelus australis TaxID=614101 RepID=A0ABQ9HBG8_9NEOP|nr:hypothetical protein PR048_018101 [Dryococelus australis]
MCFKWAVKFFTSSPDIPKRNQVECINTFLKVCLAVFHNQDHTEWDRDLELINASLNSAIHDSTGSPPSLPFLGYHLPHPYSKDVGSKFIPKFLGPFQIYKFLAKNAVILCTVGTSCGFRKVHVSHLKRYFARV